jgi:hypothetical protein
MIRKKQIQLLLTISSFISSLSAQANVIYRCGNLYSEKPCPDAQTLELTDIDKNRSKLRDKQTRSEQQQARELQRERLRQQHAQDKNKKTDTDTRPLARPSESNSNHAAKPVPVFKAKTPRKESSETR